MIAVSFEHLSQIVHFPPQFFPTSLDLEGYIKGFTFLPFGRYFLNTTETAVLSTIGAVLSASLAGFAFARLHSPTKQFLFPLVLSTMMLPATVLLIPQYVLFSQLHWVNTYLPLIVPSYLGGSAFLIRQFFAGIPEEVFEAARIDGCGYLGMYWSIARPLGIPAFIAAMVFHFQFSWNDFINPLIYLNSNTKDTVALGLVNFRSAYGATPWNQLMAVSLVFALIPLVLFFLVQRQLVSGMDRGDVSIVLRVEAANAAYGHYPAPRVIGAGAHYAVAVILRC